MKYSIKNTRKNIIVSLCFLTSILLYSQQSVNAHLQYKQEKIALADGAYTTLQNFVKGNAVTVNAMEIVKKRKGLYKIKKGQYFVNEGFVVVKDNEVYVRGKSIRTNLPKGKRNLSFGGNPTNFLKLEDRGSYLCTPYLGNNNTILWGTLLPASLVGGVLAPTIAAAALLGAGTGVVSTVISSNAGFLVYEKKSGQLNVLNNKKELSTYFEKNDQEFFELLNKEGKTKFIKNRIKSNLEGVHKK
jgi:hypothetical protein